MHGTMEAGFAWVDGSPALLMQLSDKTDKQLADHEARLDALERNRWPLASIAAVTTSESLLIAVWPLGAR
ncbi:hypothetical protein [Streptomyces sp. NPDC094049]|uniref:hypothetical protein n=1 Tax=Streptomyces sp. NPDC094049 TaxID=3154987 RepID=UPI003320B914